MDEQLVASDSKAEDEEGISTVTASTVNLINNIVGAGMFSMPWCLMECTLFTGVLLMLFMCFLNAASFIILARCCELAGSFSYLEMGRKAFGDRFGCVVQVVPLQPLRLSRASHSNLLLSDAPSTLTRKSLKPAAF